MSTPRWDETWHRLREWTNGQAQSERLAAQVLLADGFTGLDPSHPLGGPDGGKDASCTRNGVRWAMHVYFPRGQQHFGAIKKKFLGDLDGARANNAVGIAFVTNQELLLSEREELARLAAPTQVELYHLERGTAILDAPQMALVRKQLLGIDFEPSEPSHVDRLREEIERTQRRLEGLQTGGDTFCYVGLHEFDMAGFAKRFCLIKKGEFPLYDVTTRVFDRNAMRDHLQHGWGEINAPAHYINVRWLLPPSAYYRILFNARNGAWHQDLILERSETAGCWVAATRIIGKNGRDEVLRQVDREFVEEFGGPQWKP